MELRAVRLYPGGQADGGGPQALPLLSLTAGEGVCPSDSQDLQLLRQKILSQRVERLGDLCGLLPLLRPLFGASLPLLLLGDLPAFFLPKSEHPQTLLSAGPYFPVEPKPPAPRSVSSSSSTSSTSAWTTGVTISWAMRSPGWTVYSDSPELYRPTMISPL